MTQSVVVRVTDTPSRSKCPDAWVALYRVAPDGGLGSRLDCPGLLRGVACTVELAPGERLRLSAGGTWRRVSRVETLRRTWLVRPGEAATLSLGSPQAIEIEIR